MAPRIAARAFWLLVVLVAASSAPQPTCAQTLRGRLVDAETERPIAMGLMVMMTEAGDSVSATLTNDRGYFSLTSPEKGSFLLQASALGYRDALDGIFELGLGGDMAVEFRIAPAPLAIDGLIVSLDRPVFEHRLVRNGFVQRYHTEVGGHFITPYDIEKSPARKTEELFMGVPGLTVRPRSGLLSYLGDEVWMRGRGGGTCRPGVVVDGSPVAYDHMEGVSLSTIVPLASVVAVEVYRSPAETPPRYNATRGARQELCGVLVFWTGAGT